MNTFNKHTYHRNFLKKGNLLFGCVCLLIFTLIYVLNIYFPLWADDWMYSFGLDDKRIASFTDILKFQYHHYMTWGGRSIAHFNLQIMLFLGEGFANLINSIVFLAFVIIIYKTARLNNPKLGASVSTLVLICILLWFLQSNFSHTVLWLTGSANYLWSSFFTLLFLYPFCFFYMKPSIKKSKLRNLLFLVGGIVAAWTVENMSISLVCFILTLFILLKYENRKIPEWAIFGFIGSLIGLTLLFAAPGNYVRYDIYKNAPDFVNLSDRVISFLKQIVRYYALPSLVYFAIIFFFHKYTDADNKHSVFRLSMLFYFASFISLNSMFFSPLFPQRAWFGIITFVIVAISILYSNLEFSNKIISRLNYTALFTSILLFFFTYIKGLPELMMIDETFKKRAKEINQQKEQGKQDIVLHGRFKAKSGLWYIIPKVEDFTSPPTKWTYVSYAKYYDVASVVVTE